MHIMQGIGVSPGVAIGEAVIIDHEGFRIPRRYVRRDAVAAELRRLRQAMDDAAGEIGLNRDAVTEQLGPKYGAIFAAHLEMLRDPRLLEELTHSIQQRHYSPEHAVSVTLRRYAKVFQQLDSPYLAERAHDIFDLEKRLLGCLLGHGPEWLAQLSSPVIVLAHDLTPSETAMLDRRFVLAFATEQGGQGGHTAIVAKGLEIPAVVGLGPFLSDVAGGDRLIVDGDQGLVILAPDEETLARNRRQVEEHRTLTVRLGQLRDLPAETADGVPLFLAANIEFPHEVAACLERGAAGVGLYRTEFLYLGMEREPTEEDHYEAYAQVGRTMQGRPVVIRTLDLGADKMGRVPRDEEEPNPCLGLRSIRLSLKNIPLFRIQLRAILRASVAGNLQIMFPMIATLHELRRAKMVLADAMEDLEEAHVPFNRNIRVGMMVEVPSAVLTLDRLLPEVDFISLGTNDLTQYTLAVDRSNRDVAELYQACDPAVLRLIRMSVDAAARAQVPISVCGQMGGAAEQVLLLLGIGLRSFSVPPVAVPGIKMLCRSVSLGQCQAIAERAEEMETAREIDAFLRDELNKAAPELVH